MARQRRSAKSERDEVPVEWMRRAATPAERARARLLGVEPVRADARISFRPFRPGMERLEVARSAVRIEAVPFVSAATVGRAYGRARRWLWRNALLRGEPGPGRALKPELLKLLAFVAARRRSARSKRRPPPSWRTLRDAWVRYHPGKRYEGEQGVRHFAADHDRARALLPGHVPAPAELR